LMVWSRSAGGARNWRRFADNREIHTNAAVSLPFRRKGRAEHRSPVALHELAESRLVAGAHLLDKLAVIHPSALLRQALSIRIEIGGAGSEFQVPVPRFRFPVPGFRFPVPGSRFGVRKTRSRIPRRQSSSTIPTRAAC
jgi:hypothetical protein